MDWRGWAVLGVMVLVLGIIVGVMLKRDKAFDQLEAVYLERISQLQKDINSAKQAAEVQERKAGQLQKDLDHTLAQLFKARTKRQTRKRPTTMAECVVELDDLNVELQLADRALQIREKQVFHLRNAISSKNIQIAALEETLDLQSKRIEGYQRREKRQKWRTAGIVLGSVAATFGITVGATYAVNQ